MLQLIGPLQVFFISKIYNFLNFLSLKKKKEKHVTINSNLANNGFYHEENNTQQLGVFLG